MNINSISASEARELAMSGIFDKIRESSGWGDTNRCIFLDGKEDSEWVMFVKDSLLSLGYSVKSSDFGADGVMLNVSWHRS